MPRLVMLLPHYPPDVAADGQLFALLARELVKQGMKVRVLTWRPRYQGMAADAPARETRDGVEVRRVWAPRTGKSFIGRAFGALWITWTAAFRALFSPGVLLIPSSPPTLGVVGWKLSWFGRRYIYVLHDIHPDLGLALGQYQSGLLAALLRFTQRRNLARGRTVAITDGMAERARSIQPRADIRVIENWVDPNAISPRPKQSSAFARSNGLVEPFVIQYSGNLGLLHPLDGLVGAMRELPDCVLTFIGRGARLEATRKAAEGMPNVRFFDYQPLEKLPDSLAACDLAVVCLEPGADRLAMPSKLVGVLASGRAVLVLAPQGSEIAQLVESARCGAFVSNFNDAKALATSIAQLRSDPARLAAMGRRARELATTRFALSVAAEKYETLIRSIKAGT